MQNGTLETWKYLDSRVVHENPYFGVREDDVITPAGDEDKYYVITKPWATGVVPVTRENGIVLIGQYRYPTQRYSWEIPAGAGDAGEEIIASARRELWEETGLTAVDWQQLGVVQSFNGSSNEMGMMFLVWDMHDTGYNEADIEGITEIKTFSWDEVKEMMRKGEITDSFTFSALMQAALYLQWL